MAVSLRVLGGKTKGRVIPLPAAVFTIGRGPKCHIRTSCPLVSRRHCALAYWAGKLVIRDLKSANGTLVNDQPVVGEVRVWDGDVVQVGSLRLAVTLKPDDASPVPVVRESDVHWLLQLSDDSPPQPSETVRADKASLLGKQALGKTLVPAGDQQVSAGDLLRDYLRQRKH